MVTSDFRPEVEILPFRACAMHPAIILGTVRSLSIRQILRSTERISSFINRDIGATIKVIQELLH